MIVAACYGQTDTRMDRQTDMPRIAKSHYSRAEHNKNAMKAVAQTTDENVSPSYVLI